MHPETTLDISGVMRYLERYMKISQKKPKKDSQEFTVTVLQKQPDD